MAKRKENHRRGIKPLGVAERVGDAPPSHYTYGGTGRVNGARTYKTPDAVEHRFDGMCHPTCEDVR